MIPIIWQYHVAVPFTITYYLINIIKSTRLEPPF